MKCISCGSTAEIIYRKMCAVCTRDFRYARYRGWIERRAMRLGRPVPREGVRNKLAGQLKRVAK